jgi:tetratricopeptide (TPR) repeat protein
MVNILGVLRVACSLMIPGLLSINGVIFDTDPGVAADLPTWRHCMQLSNPALSETACSTIIDSQNETDQNLAYAYLYRARAEASCSRRQQATTDFTAALQGDPTLVHAWYGLGQLAMSAQDYVGAEPAFTKAIEADGEDADVDRVTPDSPGTFRAELLNARGSARYKKGDMAGALADLTAAIKMCPTCTGAYRNRAIALVSERRIDEALADLNHTLALNPRSIISFYMRGAVFARTQKFDQAIVNFSEAIRLNPRARASYRARAAAYDKTGKTKEAIEDRQKADTIDAELKLKAGAACGGSAADADSAEGEGEVGVGEARDSSTASETLGDPALMALVSGKKWPAKQGLWSVELEFRRDHTFRQRARDDAQGGKLQVTVDGAWFTGQGRLCLYTSAELCLTAQRAKGAVIFARQDGTPEFVGQESKFQAIRTENSSAPVAEYPLDEQFHAAPPGSAKGPKTLLYNIERTAEPPRTNKWPEEYLTTQLRVFQGWDVVDADLSPKRETQHMAQGTASAFAVASYVARRIKEFKGKGYQRIFVSGQLIGGWAALALSTQAKLPIDGIILFSPFCCNSRLNQGTDSPTKDFINNGLYFEQLIAQDTYPTVAVFFSGDDWDPGGRAEIARAALRRNKVASLVIDKPRGFSGETSMWLPVFDFLYRDCIVAFLGSPKTALCPYRRLPSADFRTVFTSRQLPDIGSRQIDPATLVGKEFASYPTPQLHTILSTNSTLLIGHEAGQRTVPSEFRDGRYCVRERIRFQWPVDTNEHCYIIARWSMGEMMLVDGQQKTSEWWVEKRD